MFQRTRFVPHDQDREDQKVEERAQRRADFHMPIPKDTRDPMFGEFNPMDEEFDSIEDFVEHLLDNERECYSHYELACLNYRTGLRYQSIKESLAMEGFKFRGQARERKFRFQTDNPHNRWSGPQ